MDGPGVVHKKVSQAWNIRCDVYQYNVYIHEVFPDICAVPGSFCFGLLHLVERPAGQYHGPHLGPVHAYLFLFENQRQIQTFR